MKFKETLDKYFAKLDTYSEEVFLKKPDENTWSLGQIYVHVLLGNEHFFLKQADQCLRGEETSKGKGKNFNGKLIFFINGFPNIKFKMPKNVEVPPRQPESIAYVRKKLEVALELANEIDSRLGDFNSSEKTRHPAFGYLNAKEWYRMTEMHFRHHLRQIKRIEKVVGA